MKKKRLEVRRVEIEWVDSTQYSPPWWNPQDAINLKTDVIKSTAWLLHKDKKRVVIATSVQYVNGDIHSAGQVFLIPAGCITKLKYLK